MAAKWFNSLDTNSKNATSENLVLAPFDYNMVGFFLHTFFIDFLSCMKARLTCNKKNNVKYLLQEKSDKNIFQKVLTLNRAF